MYNQDLIPNQKSGVTNPNNSPLDNYNILAHPNYFEGLLKRHGQAARVLQVLKCACSQNGQPNIYCTICGGLGYTYNYQKSLLVIDENSPHNSENVIFPLGTPIKKVIRVQRSGNPKQGGMYDLNTIGFLDDRIYVDGPPMRRFDTLRATYEYGLETSVTDENPKREEAGFILQVTGSESFFDKQTSNPFKVMGDITSVSRVYNVTQDYTYTVKKFEKQTIDLVSTNPKTIGTAFTTSATCKHLKTPVDTEDTLTGSGIPSAGANGIILTLGTFTWTGVLGDYAYSGQSTGTTYGAVKFSLVGGNTWDDFDTGNGLRTINFDDGTGGDGGYIEFYYHEAAWRAAFEGNSSNIIISQEGRVYKGSISLANLVVDETGGIIPLSVALSDVLEVDYNYMNPFKVATGRITKNSPFNVEGEELATGDTQGILTAGLYINKGDIVTLLSSRIREDFVLVRGASGTTDEIPQFDIVDVIRLVDEDGVTYTLSTDFYVTNYNEVKWKSGGSAPAENKQYTVSCLFRPSYRIYKQAIDFMNNENKYFPNFVMLRFMNKFSRKDLIKL